MITKKCIILFTLVLVLFFIPSVKCDSDLMILKIEFDKPSHVIDHGETFEMTITIQNTALLTPHTFEARLEIWKDKKLLLKETLTDSKQNPVMEVKPLRSCKIFYQGAISESLSTGDYKFKVVLSPDDLHGYTIEKSVAMTVIPEFSHIGFTMLCSLLLVFIAAKFKKKRLLPTV